MSSLTAIKTSISPGNVDNRPVGLLRRVAAIVYDMVLLIGPLGVYGFLLALIRAQIGASATSVFGPLGLVLIPGLFFCWTWTHGGQTLGMTAWKIRVICATGGPVTWRAALVRYCAAWLSLAAVGLGFAWAWIDRYGRTWHDLASGTRLEHVSALSKPQTGRPA